MIKFLVLNAFLYIFNETMNINNWWIRDLFRYSLALLSSIIVVLYFVFSFFIAILWDKDSEKLKNSLSKTLIESSWNIIDSDNNDSDNNAHSNHEKLGLKLAINYKKDKTAIITYRKIMDNTNQFLRNDSWIDSYTIVEDDEYRNKFDIEKIISDLNLQKEKRVAVIAKELWVDWKKEKWDYAKLAWIQWNYNWSLEQNQKIRNYLIDNAQEIYKDKHWRNEWDTLPLVAKEDRPIKLNEKDIKWQVTYNDVTLKVSAPAGSFPEWTVLKIKTLWDDDSMTTFDITLKEVILMTQIDKVEYDAPMASFDISFYAPDDTNFLEELQPAEWKYVSVTFDYTDSQSFKEPENEWFLAVYHMEENDETSIANLVGIKDSEETKTDTKPDSISIYANTLSVYILTIVSDLDEDVSDNNRTITFDAGYGGFLIENENIILSSAWNIDSTYTWKILSKNNAITLPNVKVSSWYNFWWWYSENIYLWNEWTIFQLWNFNQLDINSENIRSNYDIYACLYNEWSNWDLCTSIQTSDDTLSNEDNMNTKVYTPSTDEIQKYGQEMFDAYNWAITNWITNIDDINKAKLNTKITRAELAKMMVVFMSSVLNKEPIIQDRANYSDVDPEKLWDLAWYIQLAYQYQIMGINADWSPIEDFNPNKPISRWEFATVLSRILYGNTYNQNWVKFYEKHIKALNDAQILSDTNPNLTEWRWWIMTMLYRSSI